MHEFHRTTKSAIRHLQKPAKLSLYIHPMVFVCPPFDSLAAIKSTCVLRRLWSDCMDAVWYESSLIAHISTKIHGYRAFLYSDRHILVAETAKTLTISHVSVSAILHDHLTLVLLNPDMSRNCKQYRSRSFDFWRSKLIRICTVC